MENYNKKTEQNLIEMVKQKEQADKNLLTLEVVLGVVSTAFLLAMIAAGAVFMKLGAEMWVFFLMFGVGLAQFCQQVRQGSAVVLLRFRRAGGKGEHQGHGNDGYVSDRSHFVTF